MSNNSAKQFFSVRNKGNVASTKRVSEVPNTRRHIELIIIMIKEWPRIISNVRKSAQYINKYNKIPININDD